MNSPIKWVGGKRKEIKYFKQYIPKDFEVYVEPFVGGGALYWHLEPKRAVINDVNEHLINFYKVLRDNYCLFASGVKTYANNKEFFNEIVIKLNNKNYKSEIEQAEIFYYLNKTAFSGKWRVNSKGKFNSSFGYYEKDNYKNIEDCYSDLLKRTEIHNKDYKVILEEYKNDSSAFIFLDPPYLDCDTFYTDNQNFDNIYQYIFEYFEDCKCSVMLVVKETGYIKKLFKDYIIDSYDVNYRHNANSKIIHKHLIITK